MPSIEKSGDAASKPTPIEIRRALMAEWRRVARVIARPDVELDSDTFGYVSSIHHRIKMAGMPIDPMADAIIRQLVLQVADVRMANQPKSPPVMFRVLADGHVSPCLPHQRIGRVARFADGREFLSLDQAAKKTGEPAHRLVRRWDAVFGDLHELPTTTAGGAQ